MSKALICMLVKACKLQFPLLQNGGDSVHFGSRYTKMRQRYRED